MTRTAVAAAVAGAVLTAAMGASAISEPALQADPGCDAFGWRHPLCGGGAWGPVADDGIPGDNAAEGGIPAPASVPNVDGSLSPPGMPGDV
ncbi:hypothetical protein ACIA48_02315 [Mycobacterium sp. NPDC051804]|uniref:hypothetical protein n=1 Tax=Mycobacterium sp. NPDC051804 TaxID=3364295 RepID=UPI0037873EFA